VLDCACGIGTQAIGLAKRGYRVVRSDISRRDLERAEREAARLGVQLELVRAAFCDLTSIDQRSMLSCDATTRSRTSSPTSRSTARSRRCIPSAGLG
jgi:ubiquinone/menaquinone biosynthesis C-methylase UbiE